MSEHIDKLRSDESPPERSADIDEAELVSSETISYGLGESGVSPSAPKVDEAPSGVKFCKHCMKTQPSQGTFCVYCGSHDLTVIQTIAQESYLNQVVAGKFKIIEFIDRGGMGEVYLGLNESLRQKVAIKFLHKKFASDESLVMRFLNEARSYCRVHHPNAVTLLEYGQHDDGALYIITEFIEGKSLTKTLKERGPMDADKVISIGKQICGVLSAAHREGVIHRDLKPDNIMLIPGPRDRYEVKVLDFGIAKIKDDENTNLTETGAIFGTPEFMSPEQARGDGAEPSSDLYALGLILYYVISGKLPFSGKNKFALLHQHIHDEPLKPSERVPHRDISPELESVILRCMRKNPADRYEDADAVYDALEAARTTAGISSPTMGPRTPSVPSIDVHQRVTTPAPDPNSEREPQNIEELELSSHSLQEGVDLSRDLEDGLSEQDSAPIELADTISPSHEHALDLDSIDLSRERPEDLSDDELELPKDSSKRAIIVAALIGAIIISGFIYTKTRTPTSQPTDDPALTQGAPFDMQQLLLQGQAQALINLSRDALDEGKLDEVSKHLETTHHWLSEDALPADQQRIRAELEARLTTLRALDKQAQQALDQGQCNTIISTANTIQASSQGLAALWRERAFGCQKDRPADKPPTKPNPAKPTPAPQPTQPAPATPEPVKPPVITPTPPQPDPIEPTQPAQPAPATPEPANPQPTKPKADMDGMALPPKML